MLKAMNYVRRHWCWFVALTILVLAATIRLHNAGVYNPLWGYDGGAHLDYIRIIQTQHRLPTPAETYLAWHEPLYYILASLTSGASLKIFQSLIGVAFVAAIGWLAIVVTRRPFVALLTMTVTAVLPPAVFVSAYPTNELLAQTLFVVVLAYATGLLRPPPLNLHPQGEGNLPAGQAGREGVILGILLGAAQWTKLSAVIVVAAVVISLLATAHSRRSFALLRMTGIALGIWLVLSAPWQIYRQTHLGGALRINNFESPAAATYYPINRRTFFRTFDAHVFQLPVWRNDARSFWSALYASTFGDYDNIFGNVDRDGTFPSSERLDTPNGRAVPLDRLAALIALARYSIVFIPIATIGLWWGLRKKNDGSRQLLAVFSLLSVAALIYNVARYPFIDRGMLKSIFILAALPLPLLLGFDALHRNKKTGLLLAGIVALFVAFALPVVWITSG